MDANNLGTWNGGEGALYVIYLTQMTYVNVFQTQSSLYRVRLSLNIILPFKMLLKPFFCPSLLKGVKVQFPKVSFSLPELLKTSTLTMHCFISFFYLQFLVFYLRADSFKISISSKFAKRYIRIKYLQILEFYLRGICGSFDVVPIKNFFLGRKKLCK